jgi:hypothetical protein
MNMYFIIHFFSLLLLSNLLELSENLNFDVIVFHKFENIVMIQRVTIIPHENDFQKLGGTQISTVLALRMIEKSIIETLSDPIIIRGIFLLFPSSALAPRTMGKSGRTHGARTVSTPERNAITSKIIIICK